MRIISTIMILIFLSIIPAMAQFDYGACRLDYAQQIVDSYMRRVPGSESWIVNLHQTCASIIYQSGAGEQHHYEALQVLEPHAQAVQAGIDNRPSSDPVLPDIEYDRGRSHDGPPGCPAGQTMILGMCH